MTTPYSRTEETVFARLLARQATLATAESCSGGLIAHRLTSIAGISEVYLGGVVAYSNALKTALLRVAPAVLNEHGAVSEPVARQMAEGVRELTGADYGVGVTGIAGPGGGTPEKPVGLVYLAAARPGGTAVQRCVFPGTRDEIKAQTAEAALKLLEGIIS